MAVEITRVTDNLLEKIMSARTLAIHLSGPQKDLLNPAAREYISTLPPILEEMGTKLSSMQMGKS